jgi:hypothetical protein
MMFQVEFLTNESLKTNKKITNLIHFEYIDCLFLFDRRLMQRSYIFMIEKIECSNMSLSWNRFLVTINFLTKHEQSYFNSFIYILYRLL